MVNRFSLSIVVSRFPDISNYIKFHIVDSAEEMAV